MLRRHRPLWLIAVLLWGLGGCGGTEQDGVLARDLATGEIETFSSSKEVPAGYLVCSDAICEVPPGTPCEVLGQELCAEQQGCRLFPVWCTGSSSSNELPGGADEQLPNEEHCEYLCIADQLLCEELQDAESCQGRSGCAWTELCPACATADGSACACEASCVPSAPPLCEQLDEASCLGRPECEWHSDCPCTVSSDGSSDPGCACAAICLPAGLVAPKDGWDYGSAIGEPDPTSPCQRTGCNGELCAAVPLSSSCEWQKPYLCYDLADCGMLVDGSCGWIPTKELTACLNGS